MTEQQGVQINLELVKSEFGDRDLQIVILKDQVRKLMEENAKLKSTELPE